jgi:hypothetical protein
MYLCCDLEFDVKEEYLAHFESEHEWELAIAEINCGFVGCSSTFLNKAQLKKHVFSHKDVFDLERYIRNLQENGGDFFNPKPDNSVDLILSTQCDIVAQKLSSLYAEPSMTYRSVDDIVKFSVDLANSSSLFSKRDELFKMFSSKSWSREELQQMAKVAYSLSHPFVGFETEEKRMARFEKLGTLIPFVNYDIGRLGAFSKACVFELEPMLKNFFQTPDVLYKVQKYMTNCEDERGNAYKSLLQGKLWERKKALFPGKMVIPLTLYCGDFPVTYTDIKIGVFYLNVPALPMDMRPLLDFVFIAGLHFSADRTARCSGNNSVIGPIMERLQKLQDEGLTLDLGASKVQVYFCLTHVQADNLVLDELLGLPTTNVCRFCTADEHLRKTMVRDDDSLLRENEPYPRVQCELNCYGVHYQSIENWYLDIVKDFLKGVCKLDLVHILTDLIFVRKIITVDDLNQRMLTFNYSTQDRRNMPAAFWLSDLKNGKIKMKAVQIECFVRNFPLIMADVMMQNVERLQLQSWKLFMSMRKILYMLLAQTWIPRSEGRLRDLVDAHHTLFKQFAPYNGTLPLKFHNATHYWRIVQQLGPPNVQEARPKVCSEHCLDLEDEVDVFYPITWKHQMILNEKLLLKNYTVGDDFKAPKLQFAVDPESEISIFGLTGSLKSVLELKCFEEIFKIGSVVVIGAGASGLPEFCQIEHIILVDGGTKRVCKFVCAKLEIDLFEERLGVYCVSESKPKDTLIVDRGDFMWRRCFNAHKLNGAMYVSLHAEMHL